MKKIGLYVVTTLERIQSGEFSRFMQSVDSDNCDVIVGCRGFPVELIDHDYSIEFPLSTSLSKARNLLLEFRQPTNYVYISFPDDDCWYPQGLTKIIEQTLDSKDFVIFELSENPHVDDENWSSSRFISATQILREAKSVTLFLRTDLPMDLRFNEQLGLGTYIGSGEDTEFALRIWSLGMIGVHMNQNQIGHRISPFQPQYFPGSIAALRVNLKSNPQFALLIARRLIHGFLMVITGKLPFDVWKQSIWLSIKPLKS